MKTNNNNISILNGIDLSASSEIQMNVVIFFPSDTKGFEKSMTIFETLCRGLHFINYSFLEMQGSKERKNLKTHYFLFNENWIIPAEKNNEKPKDQREKFKNFDKKDGIKSFRNYEYLDFLCETRDGDSVQARNLLQSLKDDGKSVIGFFDTKDFDTFTNSENSLLKKLWNPINNIHNLSSDAIDELKCRLEHQHWCAEKLMCGFRELDKNEFKEFTKFRLKEKKPITESAHWGMHKEMFDKKRLYASMKVGAHLDLCSFEELMHRDFSTVHLDLEHFEQIVSQQIGVKLNSQPKNNCKTFDKELSGRHSVCRLFRPEKFDRFLANFNKISLIEVVIAIFLIPMIIATFAFIFSIKDEDMFNAGGIRDCNRHSYTPHLFWSVYYQFVDPGNQHMVGSPKGLLPAGIAAFLGMFCLNGFLISSVVNFVERHVQNWREGKTRYHFKREKHVAIIGGHEMIVGILKQIDQPKIERFIIMTEQDIPNYREYLYSHLPKYITDKIVFYRGDRTSRIDIESLYVNDESLLSVYVIGEGKSNEELEANHDSRNMTCVNLIADIRLDSKMSPLHCYVMFEHRSSYVAFQQAELPDKYKNRLLFEPFNIFEMCVQDILVDPKFPIQPIDITRFSEDLLGEKNNIDMDSKRRVHLVIFGMSKIGMALASEAAIICHYPNYAKAEMLEDMGLITSIDKGKLRMLITFIDIDAEQQMKFYHNRMPSLFEISRWKYMDAKTTTTFDVTDKLTENPDGFEYANLIDPSENVIDKNFLDVEWEFITGALGDMGVTEYLKTISKHENEILTIAVCLPNGQEGLSLASTIPVDVYDKAEQVLVYQKNTDGIVKQMAGNYKDAPVDMPANRFGKLRPFGMYSSCFNQALLENAFAKKIFSSNYKRLKSAIEEHKPISTFQLKELATLPILERWSAVYSAHNWSVKFRSMGMTSGELPSKEILTREFFPDKDLDGIVRNTQANIWGRVEHNRWNLERLIKIGERPIGISEVEYNENGEESIKFKESYKRSAKRSHLNICSMKRLKQIDKGVVDYDIDRNYRLVEIYEALQNKNN